MLLRGTLEAILASIHKMRYIQTVFGKVQKCNLIIPCVLYIFVQDGRTALYYAAWKGHNEVVSLLVEAHADINLPRKVMLVKNTDLM